MSRNKLLLTVLMMSLFVPAMVLAQDGGQRDNNNNGGGRRNWDPAQFRQRMAERMKSELKVTDDEWAVLGPKIEKVQTLERDMRMSMFAGRMGRRGGPDNNRDNNNDQSQQSDLSKAATDLRQALDDENTPASTINEKLLAFRTAKAKVQTDLDVARKDLKELLTPRQEAVLVMQGVLE